MKITAQFLLRAGLALAISLAAAPAIAAAPQYLLFQVFSGAPHPETGVFTKTTEKRHFQAAADRIVSAIGPTPMAPNRHVGFAVGPIAMDQDEGEVRSIIRDSFEVALTNNLAVALHLDDYMFWRTARGPDGKPLRENPNNVEWRDWQGTPAEPLNVGWLKTDKLSPQMCYESPEIRGFVTYWSRDVIGDEVRKQLTALERAGKAHLFAGIIAGWESNLAYGYCSLAKLGFSASNPPVDFDLERERILQRHIARLSKGLNDAGIRRDLIFTHIAPIPKSDFDHMTAALPRDRIRKMHQSTVFRAFWTAFNDHANPGFSAYPAVGRFDDIYQALQRHGNPPWAMAEGTNVVLSAGTHMGDAVRSPLDWETYLAMSFNHGARIVNIFGGFQDVDHGVFRQATESPEAIAAYRKFLRGDSLNEDGEALAAMSASQSMPGNPAASDGLAERLRTLPERLQVYGQSGGDLQKLMAKVQDLDRHMKSGNLEMVNELLNEIELFLD